MNILSANTHGYYNVHFFLSNFFPRRGTFFVVILAIYGLERKKNVWFFGTHKISVSIVLFHVIPVHKISFVHAIDFNFFFHALSLSHFSLHFCPNIIGVTFFNKQFIILSLFGRILCACFLCCKQYLNYKNKLVFFKKNQLKFS